MLCFDKQVNEKLINYMKTTQTSSSYGSPRDKQIYHGTAVHSLVGIKYITFKQQYNFINGSLHKVFHFLSS